jgi:hypothetical protein
MIDLGWFAFFALVASGYLRRRPALLFLWAPVFAAACVAASAQEDAGRALEAAAQGDPVQLFAGSPAAVAIAFLGYMIREAARDVGGAIRHLSGRNSE